MTSIFTFTQEALKGAKFTIGVPLKKGCFFVEQELALVTTDGMLLHANLKSITLWPDHSIKWLQCSGTIRSTLAKNTVVNLLIKHKPVISKRKNWVKKVNNQLCIETKLGKINFDLKKILRFSYLDVIRTKPILDIQENTFSFNDIKSEYQAVFSSNEEPLHCIIEQNANVQLINKNKSLCIYVKYIVYYDDAHITTCLSLHNTQAIVANNGQWDLGNENSVYLNDFGLKLEYNASAVFASLQNEDPPESYSSFSLIQYSSGGENWDSENHKTRQNKVKLGRKGAVAQLLNTQENKQIYCDRPEPKVQLEINKNSLTIVPNHFWEKYPSSITSSINSTEIKFADKESHCEVELQAGEIKAHSFDLTVCESPSTNKIDGLASVKLCEDNLLASQAILFMHVQENPLLVPIQEWYNKRERLDEYGWRNYGDIYADHEAANYKSDGIFVSHYNNQYDPLYGFLKQWLVTGKQEYKKLADDLFDHLIHIDIYHTNEDKPEYNQGLFWHTDHYVPAETATHRTYSIHQETGVYMDHAGGGGPGPHHCYSSGLALYFLLTGNSRAQSVTLNLAKWMNHIYEGDGTLLGLVLRIKNANFLKIPFTKKLLLGFGTGVIRNVFTQQYPLDRGTGNLVNVLLDSYQVSACFSYLTQAEFILVNTISENDDINTRNFDDIESTWFYTVVLQAACKYLSLISQFSFDNSQHQNMVCVKTVMTIKRAFLHYASWMSKNEKPYLDNAEKLEYPNDTWTGQDLRKIQILLCAYEMTHNKSMLQKAKELSSYVTQKLSKSQELAYARVQALLMQNTVEESAITGAFANLRLLCEQQTDVKSSNAISRFNRSFYSRLVGFVKNYSLKHEINMLCVRIPVFKKIFKKR